MALLVALIAVQLESVRRGFRVYHIWIDPAAAGCQRGLYPNNSRGFGVVFSRGCIVTTQFVHQLGRFMVQRSEALCLAIVNLRSSNFPDRKSNQGEQRN